ncbi:hypothetical protein ZYGR_0I03020 [Zygosaccharomyces rouxii]|uniref:Lysophospholipase n=1 Tax=Zygosaccharomyces rouxii TaxID=4956 RepID=A0A1Q2ZWU6_ZYGRO|nr:hypothetical protein ZYGR_0I03020 [Zygosaccharomyces rouxii]
MNFIESLLVLVVAGLAAAWSPKNSYVPSTVNCPDDIVLVREANGLSDNETEWLKRRRPIAKEALHDFVKRATKNFSDNSLVDKVFSGNDSHAPVVAIGASGGGYRAMLSGAGMISAFDNRTRGADEHGLGGVLQGATYLAGLSGGNWLTGTLAWNNWTSVQTIVDNTTADDSIWDISHSLVNPDGVNVFGTADHWEHIFKTVRQKHKTYNASLTDLWGRALSYDFFPSLYRGGEAYTWSTLRDAEVFENGSMPFPISVADGRYPGTSVISLNATVFEFNPFEMGSWDPSLRAFTDVKYLGTKAVDGKPEKKGECVAGYDNVGFIMGTSSTLFNQFLLRLNTTGMPRVVKSIISHFLKDISKNKDDIAVYSPNPFLNTSYVSNDYTSSLVDSKDLYLVDGGEDNENIPLLPFLQKERGVDVIFALDNSADTTEYWPDGSSLVATYERQFGKMGKDIAFPYVPDVETFVAEGLNTKPTFFGCDAQNMSDLAFTPPLVVYVPNSRMSYNGNQSTFKLSYSDNERLNMIKNGFEATTRNNLTDDSNFAGCVACAIMRRSQESMNATLPKECKQCFQDYCWNGHISHNGTKIQHNDDYTKSASPSATSSSKGGASNSYSPRSGLSLFAFMVTVAGLF